MNETEFVEKKRADWEDLNTLLSKAQKRGGIRAFSRAEASRFGSLYRRVASDLAYARSRTINPDLTAHLNALLSRAHSLLYGTATTQKTGRSLAQFYLFEFPSILQKRSRFFWASFWLTMLGAAFAYGLVITQPAKLDVFLPEQFRESMEVWKSGDISSDANADFAASLMTHNTMVGMVAATSGVALGVPTASALFGNGATLGAFAAVMTQVKKHATFWPGILPHGIAELTAIFICGAAGFLLASGILFPGRLTRRDSLRQCGTEAIQLVLGTLPLFIFAGVIEGMFSHLAIPAALRYAFALLNGVMWYLYLFLPRPAFEA